MATIYLVRHGQDRDNAAGILNGRRDEPLTDLGRATASKTADQLVSKNITAIYSTPLQRGLQTAEIIRRKLGLSADKLQVHPQLIERDFGMMTGKPILDIPTYCSDLLYTDHTTYFLAVEGAEDFPSVYIRAQEVLADMAELHPDENVLLVCHGDIGNMIRAAYHGLCWRDVLVHGRFDNCGVYALPDHQLVAKLNSHP